MNRELKFRAWTANSWINEGMVYDWQDTIHVESVGFVPWDENIPVMQYTGLHDKNGKEIYEGDIVLFKDLRHADEPQFVGGIDFTTGQFVIKTGYSSFGNWMSLEVEVIGNIYENPELIET